MDQARLKLIQAKLLFARICKPPSAIAQPPPLCSPASKLHLTRAQLGNVPSTSDLSTTLDRLDGGAVHAELNAPYIGIGLAMPVISPTRYLQVQTLRDSTVESAVEGEGEGEDEDELEDAMLGRFASTFPHWQFVPTSYILTNACRVQIYALTHLT